MVLALRALRDWQRQAQGSDEAAVRRFKDCMVPPWRNSTKDRTDLQKGPAHAGQSQVIRQSCAGVIKSTAPIH